MAKYLPLHSRHSSWHDSTATIGESANIIHISFRITRRCQGMIRHMGRRKYDMVHKNFFLQHKLLLPCNSVQPLLCKHMTVAWNEYLQPFTCFEAMTSRVPPDHKRWDWQMSQTQHITHRMSIACRWWHPSQSTLLQAAEPSPVTSNTCTYGANKPCPKKHHVLLPPNGSTDSRHYSHSVDCTPSLILLIAKY